MQLVPHEVALRIVGTKDFLELPRGVVELERVVGHVEFLLADQLGIQRFPAVMGGNVPVYNLKGVTAPLKFTGELLADIYLGKVSKWNAPEIAALNAGVKLPNQDITVVARSDGSGTTFIFTHYLSKVSGEWKDKVGNNTSVKWPAGVSGKGNEGVAAYVQRLPGSIGYVEYAYAVQNKLVYTDLVNADGKRVTPKFESFQSAAGCAVRPLRRSQPGWEHYGGFGLLRSQRVQGRR